MRRRDVLRLISAMPAAFAPRVHAQPARRPLIVYVAPARTPALVEALVRGLRDLGYTEGQSIAIDFRFGDERRQSLDEVAREAIGLTPDVIVTVGSVATQAVKRATTTIPVVFAPVGDPVAVGVVPSLVAPGGNLTGVSLFAQLNEKRLEILREALPGVKRIGALGNLRNPNHGVLLEEARATGERMGSEVRLYKAAGADDLATRFSEMKSEEIEALIVIPDAELHARRLSIVEVATRNRMPAIYEHRDFVEAGGLMSYGPDIGQLSYRAAAYVVKILKGAKPADLPVEQPTRFELIVNAKAAKAINIALSATFLARADEVIE